MLRCILLNKFSGTTSYDCPIPASPLLSPSPPPLEAAVSPPPPSTPPPIGLSPAGTSRRALEVSSAARSTGNCLANLKCVATPPPPPSSPPSANKYCKKLKRQYKKKEEKWEKKCSA